MNYMSRRRVFNPKKKSSLEDEQQLEIIDKKESDNLFGGFREYIPMIYDLEKQKEAKPVKIFEIFNSNQ